MRKILLPLAVASSLFVSGCDTIGLTPVSPAPLQQTTTDEKALIYAYESYDAILTLVDKAIDANIIVPGSPRALAIRNHLITVRNALAAASAARKAGSATDFQVAFAQATEAMRLAKLAIKG